MNSTPPVINRVRRPQLPAWAIAIGLGVGIPAACVGVLVAIVLVSEYRPNSNAGERAMALRELCVLRLSEGVHQNVKLPAEWAHLSWGGIVTVSVLPNDRVVVFFEFPCFGHGCRQGTVVSNQPFTDADFAPYYYGGTELDIEGFNSSLHVTDRPNAFEVEVRFDLG